MGIRGGKGVLVCQWVARRTVVVLAALAMGLATMACGGPPTDQLSPSGFIGAEVLNPKPVPEITLTDYDGKPFPLRERTRGRVSLIFFGYTHCPDICPVHMANLAAVLKRLDDNISRDVSVLFITTDPARDSLPVLRHWVRQFNPDFIGLSGTDSLLIAAQRQFGLPPAIKDSADAGGGYLVGHAAQVIAVTSDGIARVWYPAGTRQRDWAHDIPRLVKFGE